VAASIGEDVMNRRRAVLALLVVSIALAVGALPRNAALVTPLHADGAITWSKDIAPLFQQHCQTCHRPGDIGAMSLLSYADAYGVRQKILRAVDRRRMPPWKPVAGFGEFLDVRRLGDPEIALIRSWVAAGAPEGDPKDLPSPRQWPDGWRLGAPDAVLASASAFDVPASDRDLYRCFVIPTSFGEDRWISAAEFLPGNRKIVHHVITYLDTSGASASLAAADRGLGYSCFGGPGFAPAGGLGGWAPGAPPQVNPEGTALLLPAGARVVMQVHYHNRSSETQGDRTQIGLHFARTPVDKQVRSIPVLNLSFVIPAGAARHEVHASRTVPVGRDLHAIGITPHMHLLGREMKVTATYPDGTVTPLIYIDDWDFHWQGTYTFKTPVPLPGGTRIDVSAVYDNSPSSLRQPSVPPRDVGWGEETADEMCIAFVRVTADAEHLGYRPR
jgi:Copper type II ascorbate-dependent monooxygenase, C-terminal domain